MTRPVHEEVPAEKGLSDDQTTRLLGIGLEEADRPIDRLLERLACPDGAEWIYSALSSSPAGAMGISPLRIAAGQVTLDQLTAMKQGSKELIQFTGEEQVILVAAAGYFFSIAAALVHFRALIGSRRHDELDRELMHLSAVSAEPWSGLFKQAAEELRTLRSNSGDPSLNT